jgi:putative peptide zinc metalloprotease protein
VEKGDLLAVLRDRSTELEIARLEGQCVQQRLRLENLTKRRVGEPEAQAQIPTAQQELEDLEERLRRRQADYRRLRLIAPRAGTVLPPAARPVPEENPTRLATWSGNPLEAVNLGSFLESETLFCLIGDAADFEAMLVIDESDVVYVAPGQPVEMIVDAAVDHVLSGTIEEVAEVDMAFVPQQLSARLGGELQTESAAGGERPATTSYLARVPLDNTAGLLICGYRGQGKVYIAPQTAAERLGRYLRRTLHFRS